MKNYNCTIICHQQLNDGLETISFSKIATSSDVEAILFASDASFWYWNAKHAYNLKGSYIATFQIICMFSIPIPERGIAGKQNGFNIRRGGNFRK